MKKGKLLWQTLDIFSKIFFSFVLVFVLYYIGDIVNSFVYNYFVFPLVATTIIFLCGVNVGRSLERMKTNEAIGFFTRQGDCKKNVVTKRDETEFIAIDVQRPSANKKILKEVEEADKIHVKVFNYNDVVSENEGEQL